MRHLAYFGCGVLFGIGLAVSGMTDPGKVIGFLDLTGRWDPSLALVMGGAVAAYGTLRLLVLRRRRPVLGGNFPSVGRERIDGRLIGGAAVFGLGWGLSGICPGPAVTNLAALRPPILVFVPAMILGMVIAQRAFGADAE